MRKVRSCGVFCIRPVPRPQYLLMKHARRWDIPKGHVEDGESDIVCALRELVEETGIREEQIEIDPEFRFENTYHPRMKRHGGEVVEKTVVVFLGRLVSPVKIRISEHEGFRWFDWNDAPDTLNSTVSGVIEATRSFVNFPRNP